MLGIEIPIRQYAKEHSAHIYVRKYDENGNSDDIKMASNREERMLIEGAINAALMALSDGHDSKAVIATAEYCASALARIRAREDYSDDGLSHINTYLTIAIPIANWITGMGNLCATTLLP